MEFPKKQKIIALLGITFLLGTYFLFLAHPVNLVTADLGRHLKNGEHFWQNWEVIKTNFYSYTHPDFPTTNHHWAGGVLFFLFWSAFGFAGPHILFIALSLLTLFIFYKIARMKSGPGLTVLAGILVMPLLAERTEVRPEVFSYLFSGVFVYLLLKFRSGETGFKKLLLYLLPVQLIWVNVHIYFVLGPAIVLAFLTESIIRKSYPRLKKYILAFVSLFAVSLINPFGLKGVTAPFNIFENFGYRLVENQTVWFLDRVLPQPNLLIFKIVFAVLVISFLAVLVKNRKGWDWAVFFLALGFSGMAWLMLRNFTIFGLFTLVIIAWNFQSAFSTLKLKKFALGIVGLAFLLTATGELSKIYPYNTNFGIGQAQRNSASAEFFKEQEIQGPIFNNYDIGGYLIFHLFPEERVFVDNRPEAYPEEFFQNIYIPMQENEQVWQEQLQRYKFNAIYFSHRDFTPWGQRFLTERVRDDEWAVVIADQWTIIMLRRNEQNQEIIEKFEIPHSNFGIAQNN